MSQLNSESRALQVIDIFQKYQFREISSGDLEDYLKVFQYKNTFLSLLLAIFQKQVPSYRDYNPSTTNSPFNTMLSSMKVCTDASSSDRRMKKIIKLLSSLPSKKDCFRECLVELSSPLHFQEAKFYSDMFNGCKFGFSFDFVNKLLEFHHYTLLKLPDLLATWMRPKKVKSTFESMTFPVFGEPFYHGFLFKLVSKDKKISIYSEYNRDATGCFPDFQKLKKILPDKASFIDFVLVPNSSLHFDNSEFMRINRCLSSGLPIEGKSSAIVLLDFYWEDDKKNLAFRKDRIAKLHKKIKKLNIDPFILGDKSTLINNKSELKAYVSSHISQQSTGCIIREANSKYKFKTPKWYKILPQFAPEVIRLVDYKYKFVPSFRLDFILGETEDNKQIILNSYDQSSSIVSSIPNLMGRYARISWQEGSDKEYKPIIMNILPETSRI